MSPSDEPLRPSKLWKSLPEERRIAAATAFWADEQAVAEHAEATAALVKQLNYRPKSVIAMDPERKARLLSRLGQMSDSIAARLLVSYHLAHQRPMMKNFLDTLGLAHEDGLLGEDVTPPEREKVLEAGRRLRGAYPEDDVRLYFTTLAMQDPDTWGALQDVLQEPRTEAAPTAAPAATPAESPSES